MSVVLAFVCVAASRARLTAPRATLMLVDRHDHFLGEIPDPADERLGFWPVAEIPPRVAATTIEVEDRRFFEHPGVDPMAVLRAVKQNLAAGRRISGASTLAMQVARLQDPGERTWLKKAVESVTAIVVTAAFGRERVLEHYLRLAPYGNNVHGIAYAARRYFDRPVEDLSWAQVALLCAIPQAPGRMNLYTPLGKKRAAERGLLDEGERDAAERELADIHIPPRPERPRATLHAVLRFADLPEGELARMASAPRVVTTLDLEMQNRVQEVLTDALLEWSMLGAGNGAVLVVDRETAEVRAAVGSSDWYDVSQAGSIDYTRTPRHPGSTLKPFLYAFALDQGLITPSTPIEDLRRGPEGVTNADDRYLGPLLPRFALANSRNVPAVHLAREIGLPATHGLLRALGLHEDERPVDYYGFGLALGGMPVTLEQLVSAYTALGNDGRMQTLRWHAGQEREPPARVFSEFVARTVTRYLADPMARLPSFPRMGHSEYPFAVAIKTGTSTDYRDAWAVGYSSRYLVGVWLGHPDWTPMKSLSGYGAAALLLQRIMLPLHPKLRDGLGDVGFPPPGGAAPRVVCSLSGKLATDACPHTVLEHFLAGEAPGLECDAHVRVAIDVRTGTPATAATPAAEVAMQTVLDLPSRWATWAIDNSLPLLPRRTPEQQPRPVVLSPEDGGRLRRDPESPRGYDTLALEGAVEPPVDQVVWYVDGEPFAVAGFPYAVRWPLEAGEHVFEMRVPYVEGARSAPVRVVVR